ncbi:Expansin-B3 [Zea mays]|uniref:Beta-expansin 1a n=2 Tax=Zea mays TaxID=4577 RepID=B4FSL7_MAIZE|nr:beta-expansin 1a precursor [Zea mays]ACF85110.1 unknown [Zea mays]ACG41825.1 beta-expansin 1a precursor [Zea mays]AQL05597.1 Expansin-B4 [Zea mays]PWZ04510.1 Expansin-B3 [Zea mays]|eukprot:NP_001151162.1 beta-expansin 1a precursor [Zea mays]
MATALSCKALAVAALLSVVSVVTYGARAQQQPSHNASDSESSQDRSLLSYSSGWLPAKATWYGAPTGAGPDDNGGACGFKGTNQYPFSSMTSCGNEPIFKDGKGCGSCYQIRCLRSNHPACSGVPQTVIITDMNYYPVAKYHFDLSGTAFGAMASSGLNDRLRHAGIIDMQFRRVPCDFPGLTVTFRVQHGSNPMYLAVLIEHANMDGDVVQADIMQNNSGYWEPLHESWGAVWRIDPSRPLCGPFSVRITNESGKQLVAQNVIPANYIADVDYRSFVQYTN